jgi:hypothetical protein
MAWQTINKTKGVDYCNDVMSYIDLVNGDVFEYNAEEFEYEWDAIEAPTNAFLINATYVNDIYKALHIDMSTKQPIFMWGS